MSLSKSEGHLSFDPNLLFKLERKVPHRNVGTVRKHRYPAQYMPAGLLERHACGKPFRQCLTNSIREDRLFLWLYIGDEASSSNRMTNKREFLSEPSSVSTGLR